jgi:hypothetical protein
MPKNLTNYSTLTRKLIKNDVRKIFLRNINWRLKCCRQSDTTPPPPCSSLFATALREQNTLRIDTENIHAYVLSCRYDQALFSFTRY